MNQKFYTRENLAGSFGPETSLQVVFKSIEDELKPRGQVVCQFKVNGMALNEEAEKRLSQVAVKDIDIIEVSSQSTSEILENILKTWLLRIPQILIKNDELSNQIRFQGIEGSLKNFVELIDDCQLLVDSVISINALFSHLPNVQSESWKQSERLIADGIGQSLTAFEKKDYTLLSDVLEYDLGHSLQSWLEIFEQFQVTLSDLKKAGSSIEDSLSRQSAIIGETEKAR